MGLFDDLRPNLEAGPESWMDRIRGEIGFTSPNGTEFTGSWIEDTRSKAKRLQMTDYLEKKFTKVRDLEIASTTHPIVFYFHGNDSDKTSEKFWQSCDEKGEWEVIHPVNGFKSYQLVSVSQKNSPVNNGGIVEFSTEWIEPQDFNPTQSGRELKSIADFHRAKLKENSALTFAEKLSLGSEALRKNMENVSGKIAGISSTALGPVAAINDFAYAAFLDSSRMIRDIKLSTIYQGKMLAGQMQNLISIALTATIDPFVRNRAYNDMVSKVVGEGFVTIGGKTEVAIPKNQTGINKALAIQLTSESCIDALCEIATTSQINSISDGLSIIENLSSQLYSISAQLDSIQNELSEDTTLDLSFTSMDSTANDIQNAITSAIRYVLFIISKSNIRKSITIPNNISTIKFYLNQYKKPDGFFNFCDRNNLTGNEFFMLPAGKEIQI